MKKYIALIVNSFVLALALIIAVSLLTWAHPCEGSLELVNGNMVPMRCLYTGKVALLVCALLAITSVVSLALKRSSTLTIILLSIMLIVLSFETPLSIGVCKSEMICWNTALLLRVGGGLLIAITLGGFFINPSRKRIKQSPL